MDKKIIARRMLRSKFFMVGGIVAVIIVILALLAPVISTYNPEKNALSEVLTAPEGFARGLEGHIFGTDELGRDIYTRLLYGARYSLSIAVITLILSSALGITLGVLAGYLGGLADTLIMRITDVFMSIPQLVLAIAVAAVLGKNMQNLILVMALTGWTGACRIARNNVLVQKSMDYVNASKVLNSSHWRIMFNQILPNILTPLIVSVSQSFAGVIIMEASLSFLGLGIQQPTPSWGNMIAAGRTYLTTCPWMAIAPGAALMITVLAFNFLGDGLRDVLDPKRI